MIDSKTLRLVLLVSCCHALVHVYELSFASVEQLVADDFSVGTEVTGALGTSLRMPIGLGALAAGWLAGHYGAKRLLLIYLVGCSMTAAIASMVPSLALMFAAMLTLGSFASIYHPAGLGLIAHHTNPQNRPMAMGYHGIFGSAGIATAPFLAAFILGSGATWQRYYLFLAIPGLVLAGLLTLRLSHERGPARASESPAPHVDGEDDARWGCYLTLLLIAASAGFIYHAVLNFLPRYLGGAGLEFGNTEKIAGDNYLTGGVLALGVLGQYASGKIARPHTLELLLAGSFVGAAASLFWMGLAEGPNRLWAAGVFTPLFFMHQPVFNSLLAKYVPRRQRSAAYGLSFTLGFGFGSLGSTFSGFTGDFVTYTTLAGLACLIVVLSLVLWRWNHRAAPPR